MALGGGKAAGLTRRAVLAGLAAWPGASRAARSSMQILFIGNSFTLEHNLPGLVGDLAEQAGWTVAVSVHARNGAFLWEHLERMTVPQMLDMHGIDAAGRVLLVLQDHSTAALTAETRARSLAAFAALRDLRHRKLVFPAWPRREGHKLYGQPAMPRSPREMADRITRHSSQAAETAGAALAPVPQAWMLGMGLPLHRSDGYHASLTGAWLTALVLARAARLAPKKPEAPEPVRRPTRLHQIARTVTLGK
jgi:hypothetical protein